MNDSWALAQLVYFKGIFEIDITRIPHLIMQSRGIEDNLPRKRRRDDQVVQSLPAQHIHTEGAPLTFSSQTQDHVIIKLTDAFQSQDKKARLQALLEISSLLPLNDSNKLSLLIQSLRSQLRVEKDKEVKKLLIRILGSVSLEPDVDVYIITLDLSSMITGSSKDIIVCILRTLYTIGHSKDVPQHQLIDASLELLRKNNTAITCECLRILSRFSSTTSQDDIYNADHAEEIITAYTEDNDERVRRTAVECLLQLWDRRPLRDYNPDTYDRVSKLLRDDSSEVRLEAVKLLWLFTFSRGRESKLLDNAFTKLANAASDPSILVRTKACSLLGSIRGVTEKYLLQTFSKEVLVGEQSGKLTLSRGKGREQQAEDEIIFSEEDVNLDNGAIGVFIQCLEDEFWEVRNAALDAICELSLQSQSFAHRSVDFLVDMFNDEIDRVRINAINSLRKMEHRVRLRENQLHIVLSALEDANAEVRAAVHRFLSVLQFSNAQSLHASIQAVLQNAIHRYPRDITGAYSAVKCMGANHPSFSESLIVPLLQLDERFIPIEPHLEDKHYVGCALFLLNASQKNINIVSKLPGYIFKHYFYLREKYSTLVPQIQHMPNMSKDDVENLKEENRENDVSVASHKMNEFFLNGVQLVSQMVEYYNESIGMDRTDRKYERGMAQAKISHQICSRDLSYVMRMSTKFHGNSRFYLSFCRLMEILLQLQTDLDNCDVFILAGEISEKIRDMNNLFLGISQDTQLEMMSWSVIHQLLICSHHDTMENKNILRKISEKIKESIDALEAEISTGFQVLLRGVETYLNSSSHSQDIPIQLVNNFKPCLPSLNNLIKECGGEILSPSTNQEKPIHVHFPFLLQLDLEATLHNVDQASELSVEIEHKGKKRRILLSQNHLQPVSSHQYQLRLNFSLSECLDMEIGEGINSCKLSLMRRVMSPIEEEEASALCPSVTVYCQVVNK
ncbi:hypothetical protein PROFUN_03788 [Planoprotostelium fungivorum]|uniref:Integrator complex subunit 4/Protein SIEL C-terminal Ig-like domain-containing protein n=1 Tax=Planoprotostelium fungivorum TaxID=1890364 RepID=A0A2P6NDQ8_9EUKA|nr:hypothetical protein PROFUN_03788 [Planoprotostelium fungivorum]